MTSQPQSGGPPGQASQEPRPPERTTFSDVFSLYFERALGTRDKSRPPASGAAEAAWAFLGCCCGIGAVAALHFFAAQPAALTLLTPAFAASAVLLYGAPAAPLAQPRNVVLGHLGSALLGVVLRLLLVALPPWPAASAPARGGAELLAGTLAVALSTALMMLGGVAHPPGAATALLAVVGGEAITSLGFLYVPLVTVSAVLMVAVAVIVNNFSALPTRRYPAFKW